MSNAERLIEALGPSFTDAERAVDAALIEEMVDAVSAIADEEITAVMSGSEHFEATYDGLEGLRDAWRDWLDTFARIRFEIEDVQDLGDNVLTIARQIGTTRHGGVEITQPSAAVWKFRDGRLRRIEFHLDREAAHRSAGLDPNPPPTAR